MPAHSPMQILMASAVYTYVVLVVFCLARRYLKQWTQYRNARKSVSIAMRISWLVPHAVIKLLQKQHLICQSTSIILDTF